MSTVKTITVADKQLLVGGGDVTRDALGLSIGSEMSQVIEKYKVSKPSTFKDGLKTGFEYNYRLFGSDVVETDKHWLSFIYGGTYAEEVYTSIFVNQTFLDHHHVENNPYSEMETKQNGTFSTKSPNYISCKPTFNNYYRLYTEAIEPSVDVTTIPNCYFISQINKTKKSIIDDFKLNRIVTEQTSSQLKNIFVTTNNIYDKIETANEFESILPYCVKTSLDFDTTGDFVKKVLENNFDYRFIKILKDTFLSQDGADSPIDVEFNLNTEQFGTDGKTETVSTDLELKVADVFDLMEYSLTDYNTENLNFEYILDSSEIARSQYNSNSVRRFEKTIPTIKQTNTLIDFLNSSKFLSTFEDEPLNLNEKYNEVVAYRIEKIGGTVTGDRFTQDAIQNFWFLNSTDVDRFEFLDNQVIFNEDYTYRIYKYVLVAGLEYSYSDLVLTRTIANLTKPLNPNWCLEFFNPESSESSPPLFNDGPLGAQALDTTLATDAQVTSKDQYLSDFKLRVLPSVKIVEVPLLTKEVSILDSPTNSVQVSPSYTLDNSNTLIFKVRYGAKVPFKMPTAVTTEDADYRQKFMNSYDFIDSDLIVDESKTLPINLEVYRIEKKPNTLSDFDGYLLKTIDLKVVNEIATYSSITVADKVSPNKKYFYLFRVVNEAKNFGAGSNILEAELVSDGGYKFGKFEVYFENELGPAPLSRTVKGFKKLLNVSPTIDNLIIDDSKADYSDIAENQIKNINFGSSTDVFWDKKYKIRLTSKKTGKKIDINITHKLVG